MPIVSAEGLYKIFGKQPLAALKALQGGTTREELKQDGHAAAVIDANFDINPGEIFVIMGLSGSGKSTLLRLINGLIQPTDGNVTVKGESVTEASSSKLREIRRQHMSMVFQRYALLPHRTIGENAAYALENLGVNRAEREREATKALRMVGLDGWEASYPNELSGGMQQRVGLARALAAGTDILLMDEAFSALDPLIRKDMQDQLIELQTELNKTIVFVTHDLNEAMRMGDRIAMMRDGAIEQIGTCEEILNNPQNDYVARFVQDVDRTRVLTASSVMEPPVEVLGSSQGPMTAHKIMRETQIPWLLVVNRDNTPAGILWDTDVARAVERGEQALPWSNVHEMVVVGKDTPMSELFTLSAQHKAPIVVEDERGRVAGVIPRITLLAAMDYSYETDSNDTNSAEGLHSRHTEVDI